MILGIIILIVSVILHELAHGYMANYLGDPTARFAGRLTLNPLSHIDPMGSIFLPLLFILAHSPILIGYAKPVPYNPYNLKGKYAEALVAGAGPATNILLALIFGMVIRFGGASLSLPLLTACSTIVFINILLALFNLIPIPPLDGSKVLSGILPIHFASTYRRFRYSFERLGILSGTLLLLFIFWILSPVFYALVSGVFSLITGIGL